MPLTAHSLEKNRPKLRKTRAPVKTKASKLESLEAQR
jgi:hypothetical protein